jgi:hypothetical protein
MYISLHKNTPINTMVRFLKLVAILDHFRAILGTLLKKRSQNGPKMVQKRSKMVKNKIGNFEYHKFLFHPYVV